MAEVMFVGGRYKTLVVEENEMLYPFTLKGLL
jgi:hypothetical protein